MSAGGWLGLACALDPEIGQDLGDWRVERFVSQDREDGGDREGVSSGLLADDGAGGQSDEDMREQACLRRRPSVPHAASSK